MKAFWNILKTTSRNWLNADPWRQAALMAYYAIFSIPGLLMIVIWAAGSLFGEEAVQGEISKQAANFMGSKAAEGIQQLLSNQSLSESNLFMKILGIGSLVFGATTLFFQLQKSLNYIWDVEQDPENSIKKLLVDRVSSLGLILVIAFLLLITLVLTAVLNMISDYISQNFGDWMFLLIQIGNFLIPLGVITLLFAAIFKVLPDVDIHWHSVWVGAFVTALLFTVGKTLLGYYFSVAQPGDSFGAAGTIILIMLWVNYSCLILFFGAEFTQTYSREKGIRITPSEHARWRPHYSNDAEEKE